MTYTLAAWRENLKTLRAQFSEAAEKWTTPRVCWFRFDYQEPLTIDQHIEHAKTFLASISNSADAADFVLPKHGGEEYQHRHYTAALLDGTAEQNALFKRLAEQAFDIAHVWPESLPVQLDQVAEGWIPRHGYATTGGVPLYILWPTIAAGVRLNHPDVRLALQTFFHAPDALIAEVHKGKRKWQHHEPEGLFGTFYPIPMKAIGAYAPFDTNWTAIRPYSGPPVYAQGFVHDVWQVSVAALDRLIEASDEPAKRTADSEGHLPAATANDTRDKWIYEKTMKGTCWDTIAVDLGKKPKSWKRISGPGCKRAAIRYAERNGLPSPPTRKQGRRKNTAKKIN